MAGQTRIDGNLIDTGTDPNDIVSVSVGDGRYPRLSEDNTLAGNLTVSGQVRSDNVTDSAGTGAPAFPNGMSATGAALTDPEITGGIYLGGTGSANYLEDYEEGTHFASISFDGGGSVGTSVNALRYIKVGGVAHVFGQIQIDTANSPTGRMNVSLPFAVKSRGSGKDTNAASTVYVQNLAQNPPDYAVAYLLADTGTASCVPIFIGPTGSVDEFDSTYLDGGNNRIEFNFTYPTEF